jgi:UDP-N-acetylmuramoyl-L-alanyl-D-glutamate--2,6-diaminopimelate ligase
MQPRALTVTQLLAALNGQVAIVERLGDLDGSITSVTDDSRSVSSGSLFVAVKGERVDGHKYVGQAIKAGAAAIVGQDSVERASVPFVQVTDSRKALGLIGSRFYGDPSAQLAMIGVTGTNGKTTTTYLCKALLENIGRRVGLIGTVAYQIGA